MRNVGSLTSVVLTPEPSEGSLRRSETFIVPFANKELSSLRSVTVFERANVTLLKELLEFFNAVKL